MSSSSCSCASSSECCLPAAEHRTSPECGVRGISHARLVCPPRGLAAGLSCRVGGGGFAARSDPFIASIHAEGRGGL
jgi:hypothetical protein